MDFSIIIPTYNDWQRLEKCIDMLQPSVQGMAGYEIIVIDNAGEHDPPEWIKKPAHIRVVHEPKPGSYVARNRGVSLASGRFLAFTDSDCIPDSRWLANALAFFNVNHCDMIGGKVEIFRENNGGEWAYIYENNLAFQQKANIAQGHSVTANFFIRRDVFEDLGGFDASIKSGGDFEFSKRAVDVGHTLKYAPDVLVLHPARKSVRELLKKQRRFASWGHLNVKKSHGHSSIRIFLSNAVHGIKVIFRRSSLPEKFREKLVIFMVSLLLYSYTVYLHFLITVRLMNPARVRE
jgi:glycosyltransferase involved in cell wall biosynthesis